MYPVLAALIFASALPQGQAPGCETVCCDHEVIASCSLPDRPMPLMDCHSGDPGYSLTVSSPTLPVVAGPVVREVNLEGDHPIPDLLPGRAEGRAPPPAWQRARTVALLC